MSAIDDYLLKARNAIRTYDVSVIDSTAKEIISAFHAEIPNISHYRGATMGGHGPHTAANLKQLMGKLLVLRDEKDNALYGEYGLMTVTDSIRKLESALLDDLSDDQIIDVYHIVDGTYANLIDAYVTGLSGWEYSNEEASDFQTQLRISKLRQYRDDEIRRMKLAKTQAAGISLTQVQKQETSATANATSIASVGVLEACREVDKLSEGSLSEDDKTFLKGLFLELEEAASRSKQEGENKLSKILGFLVDKGVDVLISAWPYLWTIMQSRMC